MGTTKNIAWWVFSVMLCAGHLSANKIKNDLDAALALGTEMSNVRAMLENYTAIGAKIIYKNPKGRLNQNIQDHESLLDNLANSFQDPFVIKTVKESKIAWGPIREALLTTQTEADSSKMRKSAQFIHDNIRSVIKKLSLLKKYFLEKSNFKNTDELNAAIEIAASARRLSAHYMMAMWKLPDPTIKKHWNQGIKIYSDSIAILKKSSFNRKTDFRLLLKSLEKILKYLVMASPTNEAETFIPSIVHKKCDKAFNAGNKMVKIISSSQK